MLTLPIIKIPGLGSALLTWPHQGDLGLTPAEVESRLQEIFRLAQAWGCVMLLDEADIFLAQRTPTDIKRNALVSGTYKHADIPFLAL